MIRGRKTNMETLKKFGTSALIAALVPLMVGIVSVLPLGGVAPQSAHHFALPTASADDDEDDDEDDEDDEDEDDEDEDDEDDRKEKKETVTVTRYEVRKISQVVTVLPPEYEKDTDGDLLVDGVDPDPAIHQREYFTDDDGDAIPNKFDTHPGEDDFAYYDGEEDADADGVLDSYERHLAQF